MRTKPEGWSWLFNARKWHYFRDGRALCRRWMILGVGDFGTPTEGEKCRSCQRAL